MLLASFYKRWKDSESEDFGSYTQGHKTNESQNPKVQFILAWASVVVDLGNWGFLQQRPDSEALPGLTGSKGTSVWGEGLPHSPGDTFTQQIFIKFLLHAGNVLESKNVMASKTQTQLWVCKIKKHYQTWAGCSVAN